MKTIHKIAIGTMLLAGMVPALTFAQSSATSTVGGTVTSTRSACVMAANKTRQTSIASAKTTRDSAIASARTTRDSALASAKAALSNAKKAGNTTGKTPKV